MPQVINVTDEDIIYAESILLPEGCHFDDERINFIKNLETIDLQAVPGSGKTTALLAKLIILEKKLPLEDDSGILVISHTNTAINEIKDKIQKHCPKLFSYPNFVGTIQSFVDQFLTIPFGVNYLGIRFNYIENEKFEDELIKEFNRVKWLSEYAQPQGLFFGVYFQRSIEEATNFENCKIARKEYMKECTKISRNKSIDLYNYLNSFSKDGNPIILKNRAEEIRESLSENAMRTMMIDYDKKSLCDYNETTILNKIGTKNTVNVRYDGFKRILETVFSKGLLSYRHAYLLAKNYLAFYPEVIPLMQKRFSFVFVDEMQDMDEYQYEILEKIFYEENKSNTKYQRIGDKNQSIYNGDAKDKNFWENRKPEDVLPLSASQRLSPSIAKIVEPFAHDRPDNFKVIGLGSSTMKPCIIKYSTSSIEQVIHKFMEIIDECRNDPAFSDFSEKIKQKKADGSPKYLIRIIAWNTEWKVETPEDNTKVRLTDYYPEFSKNEQKQKIDYPNLRSYLLYYEKGNNNFGTIRLNILNALLRILKIEKIFDTNSRYFTKKKLIDYIKSEADINKNDIFETFELKIYQWCCLITKGNIDEVQNSIIEYTAEFLDIFGKVINASAQFLNEDIVVNNDEKGLTVKLNKVVRNDIEAEITTVHSVKGQTHLATLYLESCYRKQHEIERLDKQLLGMPFDQVDKQLHIQSTKMMYVGLSRPTDLLCIAVHEERFNKFLSTINQEDWNIVET